MGDIIEVSVLRLIPSIDVSNERYILYYKHKRGVNSGTEEKLGFISG